jgi:hypothetical protein
MYHPAAALRQASLQATMQRDMAGIPEALLRSRAARQGHAEEAPELAAVAAGPPSLAAAEMGGNAGAERHDDQLGLF